MSFQLKPVRGRYIHEQPSCPEYHEAYGDGSDSLWASFSVINLTKNHRQGSDRKFADILNRVRVGEQTEEDLKTLRTRVRQEGDPELSDCTWITSTVTCKCALPGPVMTSFLGPQYPHNNSTQQTSGHTSFNTVVPGPVS